MLGNPDVDYVATRIVETKAYFAAAAAPVRPAGEPATVSAARPLAGAFVSPSFGKASVVVDGNALIMEILATGAKLKLEPWDGDVFVARLMPIGQFGPVVDLDYMIKGFVQFQIAPSGKLDVLTMTLADGQRYEFRRE